MPIIEVQCIHPFRDKTVRRDREVGEIFEIDAILGRRYVNVGVVEIVRDPLSDIDDVPLDKIPYRQLQTMAADAGLSNVVGVSKTDLVEFLTAQEEQKGPEVEPDQGASEPASGGDQDAGGDELQPSEG